MPVARLSSGIFLEYETRGRGEPVLLIAGLGRDRRMWEAQHALSARFRVITFDNRGVGGSSKPSGPYTAAMLAEDAAGLLDALELDRVHVVGASLGGLIAQELALSRPWRVARLALLCTHPGIPLVQPCAPEVVAAMVPDPQADPFERLVGALRQAYGGAYWQGNAERLLEAARARLTSLISPELWWAQAAAGGSFCWSGRTITAPTLIMTGDEDRIVPPQNSRNLARMIAGAELAVLRGGGHYFFLEQPALVNAALETFLSAGEFQPAPETDSRKETETCPRQP